MGKARETKVICFASFIFVSLLFLSGCGEAPEAPEATPTIRTSTNTPMVTDDPCCILITITPNSVATTSPTVTPTPTPPTITSVSSLSTPTLASSFILPTRGPDDTGGSAVLELVNLFENDAPLMDFARVMQDYGHLVGDLDTIRAHGLYLFDEAYVDIQHSPDYSYAVGGTKQFQYYGLTFTIEMHSNVADAFCGIRTNSDTDSYIDILVYNNGSIKVEYFTNGISVSSQSIQLVTETNTNRSGNLAQVVLFLDAEGLTVAVQWLGNGNPVISGPVYLDKIHVITNPANGTTMLRGGTQNNSRTYCRYRDFFQYPVIFE